MTYVLLVVPLFSKECFSGELILVSQARITYAWQSELRVASQSSLCLSVQVVSCSSASVHSWLITVSTGSSALCHCQRTTRRQNHYIPHFEQTRITGKHAETSSLFLVRIGISRGQLSSLVHTAPCWNTRRCIGIVNLWHMLRWQRNDSRILGRISSRALSQATTNFWH